MDEVLKQFTMKRDILFQPLKNGKEIWGKAFSVYSTCSTAFSLSGGS